MALVYEQVLRSNIHTQWTLYGSIESHGDYKELIHALDEAQEGDSIEIKINSGGGACSVGFMIAQAVRRSRAVVVCNVVYPSASMAALIAVAGDYLLMQPYTHLMFHTYSGGAFGKGDDLVQTIVQHDQIYKELLSDFCTPFLTKPEIKRIFAGEDLYIKYNDPTMPARLKRQFKDVNLQNT